MILIYDLRPLLNNKISGVEVYTKNLAKALKENITDEISLIFWTNALRKFDFGEFEKLGTCIQTHIPNKIFNISASILRYPKIDHIILKHLKNNQLKEKFKTEECILFVPDPRPSPVSKICKKILTIHDLSNIYFKNTFNAKTRLFHKLIRLKKEIDETDIIICPSQFTKIDIATHFKIDPNKINVIYEGIEPDLIDKSIKSIKPKEYIPKKFIFTLSTFEPRKNLERVIKSFDEIKDQIPDVSIVLVGRKNNKIFKDISISNKDNRYIFIERYISEQEKKWFFQNAICFIYISLFEGFGLPLIEAMSQGCPSIYGNNSSMPEVCLNTGIPVISTNNEDIKNAILELVSNKKLRDELMKKCTYRANIFSWCNTAKKLIKLITGVST